MEIIGDPLNGFPILGRCFKSSVQLQSPSLKLFGITSDFQVAEAINLDGHGAVDHDVEGVAEKVLAAVLAALGPVVTGTAIPARDPHRPGGQVAQLV